jgi:3-hydroxyisobutyrate dehydrogenase
MMKIGMVGIGMMGHGIAANIVKHNYPMVLLEHPGNQPLQDLVAAGATTTPSAAALAAAVDVVILCVTGSPEVEDVLYRKGGLLEGLKPGTIVIDCSTAIPSSTLKVAESVEKAGGRFLDAPMTRTPKEAAGRPAEPHRRRLPRSVRNLQAAARMLRRKHYLGRASRVRAPAQAPA